MTKETSEKDQKRELKKQKRRERREKERLEREQNGNNEEKSPKKEQKKRKRDSETLSEDSPQKKKKIEKEEIKVEVEESPKKNSKKDKKNKKKETKKESNGEKSNGKSSSLEEQTRIFREQTEICIDSDVEFHPTIDFESAKEYIPASLFSSFCAGFEKPTPIQAQCWPIAASGRDMIGIAETGSGKTLAFLLPGITKIQQSKNSKGKIKILVLAPTRELAMQSADVCNQASCGVSSVCIGGGVSKDGQRKAIKAGAQVVVATPGRLIDLVSDGSVILDYVEYLVLDEADRMLDMGFEDDIKKIIARVPKQRQTLMFSATWPESIRELAHSFLINPVRVTIGSVDLSASHSVAQIVEIIEPRQKDARLVQLLNEYHASRSNRVLIFCLYKKEASRVERTLKQKGWSNVQSIHGDLSQEQRNFAFKGFKDGTSPLLVATDVAARGLDIPNVEYVINYTFPLTIEDYIHRIGRTGRAGKKGIAHTLFTIEDKPKAGDLVTVLREANQPCPPELEKFGPSIHRKKEHKLYGAFYKDDSKPMPAASRITFDD